MTRVICVTVALVLAAAAVADAIRPRVLLDPHAVAVDIAGDGPRPAASRAERRAHIGVRDEFKSIGLKVEVQRFRVPGKGRSRNVIGVYDSPHACLRIVMAHTDSTPWGPGANDNASGVAVVTSLARRLFEIEPPCDVWLVATGAEERVYTGSPDHLGALALARLVKRRGLHRHLRYVLSLDEVGRDRPFWLRSPVSRPRRAVEGQFPGVRWVRDDSTGNSDHREFELMGMRGAKLGVGAGGEPCRHTACDRAGRLRRSSLEAARKLVERALRRR